MCAGRQCHDYKTNIYYIHLKQVNYSLYRCVRNLGFSAERFLKVLKTEC